MNFFFNKKFIRLLMIVSICSIVGNSQTRWSQKEFILGTYWDPPYNINLNSLKEDSISFSLAKEAHFNLLTGTQGENSIDHSFSGMTWALTIAHKVGLFYLVTDNRYFQGQWHHFDSQIGNSLTQQYINLPRNLRNTLFGYNLGDEPNFNANNSQNVSDWKWFIESRDPEKLVYINLVGSTASDENWGGFEHGNINGSLDEIEMKDYEKYLEYYIDSLKPAVVSFDQYPFFKDGRVKRDYFYNLSIIKQKAGLQPFWAYPMTVGHYDYVDPMEQHLYFMYFCPIAYGAKGLIIFSFWPPVEKGFRKSLFDRDGNKTETFDIVKRLNLFVLKVVAPIVMNIPNIAVYHVSNYPNKQQWISNALGGVTNIIDSIYNDKILVGIFHNADKTYFFVVNKDLNPISDIKIVLKGKVNRVWFSPRVIGFDEKTSTLYTKTQTLIDKEKNISTVTIPVMSGGEGRMIRIR